MASKRNKRLKLFKLGADAISKYTGGDVSLYYCPICREGFSENEIEPDGLLSLEDVPPKSLGGKPLLLTCKKCNGAAGKTSDFEAYKRKHLDNFKNFILGKSGTDLIGGVNLEIPGCQLRAELTRSNGVTIFRAYKGANSDETIEQFKRVFPKQKQFNLKKTFKINPQIASISDLKTAFLLITAWLGYRYAFDPRLEMVRGQIREPKEEILGPKFLLSPEGGEDVPAKLIVAIKDPLPCFIVTFTGRAVILPTLDSPVNFYEELSKKWEHPGRKTITGRKYPWPDQACFYYDLVE